MRKAESKEFDEFTVKVQQLPAMRAMLLSHRLVTAAAPLVSALSGGLDSDLGPLGDAAEKVLKGFSPEELQKLIRELLDGATVTVDGKEVPLLAVFDNVFAGRVALVYRILAFALEVNFGDFFVMLRGLAAKGLAGVAKQSK